MSRSCWSSHLLWHEHPDQNQSIDWIVRFLEPPYPLLLLTGFSSSVTFGLMALAFGPMLVLVNMTPERIPADVILEGQEAEDRKIAEPKAGEA